MSFRGAALLASLTLVLGCTTYHDELARGQRAFEVGDHDRTLAVLRDLEPDVKRLTPPEQAEYAYLRGMTDYRVGYRSDARHWLAVAKALEETSPGMLPVDWKERINEALTALNEVVYTQGTNGLTTSRLEDTDAKPKPDAKPDSKKDTSQKPAKEPEAAAKKPPPPSPAAPGDAGAPKP